MIRGLVSATNPPRRRPRGTVVLPDRGYRDGHRTTRLRQGSVAEQSGRPGWDGGGSGPSMDPMASPPDRSTGSPPRRLAVSPRAFRTVAVVSVWALALTIISGAAVRLTGSGLGCPDWPSCTTTSVVAPLQVHAWIEFGNRLINAFVTVASLARLGRRPPARSPAAGSDSAGRRAGWPA